MDELNTTLTMKCLVCGAEIGITDEYFAFSDNSSKVNFNICVNCAETVTPMDLYMSGKISMVNSPDNVIEIDGIIAKEADASFDGENPDCPLSPCEKCRYYYGETDTCMVGMEDVAPPTQDEIEKVRNALGDDAVEDFFTVS